MKKRLFPSVILLGMFCMLAMPSMVISQSNPCGEKAAMNPCNPCMMKGMVHFNVSDPMNRNTVTFKSEAPLEDIIGTTNQITGYLSFDPAHATKGGHGELTIPVSSLNSGIPLRDEHIRSADWLNADKYPNITLNIKELRDVKRIKATNDYQTYDITLMGTLSFNGHSNDVKFPARLTYLTETERTKQKMPGDLIAARANFEVSLADFAVTGPKGADLIGSKVGNSIAIDVSIMASNATATMAGASDKSSGDKAAMNPCGGKAMNPCADKGKTPAGNPCGTK